VIQTPAKIMGLDNAYPYILSGDTAEYYLSSKNQFGTLRYFWSVPVGATIVSGQNTDTIIVRYTSDFIPSEIIVLAYGYCGNVSSTSRSLYINKLLPAVYTFTGNGLWNNPLNWSNGVIPPTTLPYGSEIIIAHPDDGVSSCILNVPQSLARGSKLTVQADKKLIIQGKLTQL